MFCPIRSIAKIHLPKRMRKDCYPFLEQISQETSHFPKPNAFIWIEIPPENHRSPKKKVIFVLGGALQHDTLFTFITMDRRELYNRFLQQFPIENLGNMTLDEYTNLDKEDSFCYWLETKTTELGSISGGSSYKFGIYRYNKTPKLDNGKYACDEKYAWSSRLGQTAQEAFSCVRDAIVRIAHHARNAEWEEIEKIDVLWPVVTLKIAFLYSNEQMLPFYDKTYWLVPLASHFGLVDAGNRSRIELNKYLFEQKGDKDLFEFYVELRTIIREQQAKEKTRVWLFAPGENAFMWDECRESQTMRLGWDEIGDLSEFKNKDELTKTLQATYKKDASFKNDSLALWQFAHDMHQGDIVYAKKGAGKIIGRGVVDGDYYYDDSLSTYRHVRHVRWTHCGEWEPQHNLVVKTLTDVSKYSDFVKDLDDLVIEGMGNVETGTQPTAKELDTYTDADFLREVYMSSPELQRLKALLRNKKNVILQGAPGVGKTFTAERLAFTLMGVVDKQRVELVQFHQNYSYEDFILGYKPNDAGGFELRHGVFYRFCKKALNSPDKDFFFIIDEINRGNLSKIFGELLMLIENSYRGKEMKLAYTDEQFCVPTNLYIIGMMNTADRSLAMIDYALRRRFSFFEMRPGFDADGFKDYQASLASDTFDKAIQEVQALNQAIRSDDSLGEGFCIGHSYFCNQKVFTSEWLANVIEYDIAPMLKEYWFDDIPKYEAHVNVLRALLK